MEIDKTGVKDSLEKIKRNLAVITNSKYWLKSICAELDQNQLARTGLLHALYRIKQQYLDTVDDFDGEDLAVLSEEELESWNGILQKIKIIEGTDKKDRNLAVIYTAANDLLELDEADLIRRRKKLELKLYGSLRSVNKDMGLFSSGIMKPWVLSSPGRQRGLPMTAKQTHDCKIRSRTAWEKANKMYQPKKKHALDFIHPGIAIFLSGVALFIGLNALSVDILIGGLFVGVAVLMAILGISVSD